MEQTNSTIEEKNNQKNAHLIRRVGKYLAPYKNGFLKLFLRF